MRALSRGCLMPFDSTIGQTSERGPIAEMIETGWEQVVPDVHHIAEQIVLLSDGSLLAMVELPGHPFQLEEMIARNTRRDQFTQLWQNISDSNVTVGTHLVHRRIEAPPVARAFSTDFARDLFSA